MANVFDVRPRQHHRVKFLALARPRVSERLVSEAAKIFVQAVRPSINVRGANEIQRFLAVNALKPNPKPAPDGPPKPGPGQPPRPRPRYVPGGRYVRANCLGLSESPATRKRIPEPFLTHGTAIQLRSEGAHRSRVEVTFRKPRVTGLQKTC
jgi:hypothetical protein